ncbi:MAG: AAA family ATPase [Candidatus Woesearchaeota archaeon]
MEFFDFENSTIVEIEKYFESLTNARRINPLKTEDAKKLYQRMLTILKSFFQTNYSKNKFHLFYFTDNIDELKRRHEFIQECLNLELDDFKIKEIKLPNLAVKNVAFITTDYEKYKQLIEKYKNFPIFYVESNQDLIIAKDYVQIRTDSYEIANLLNNAVFSEEPFPEYHINRLLYILEELKSIKPYLSEKLVIKISKLEEFNFNFINLRSLIRTKLDEINKNILQRIKQEQFDGTELLNVISSGTSDKIKKYLYEEIEVLEKELKDKQININLSFIELKLPLTINEQDFEQEVNAFEINQMYHYFNEVNKLYSIIGNSDEFIQEIKSEIYELDFKLGIKNIVKHFDLKKPEFSNKGFSIKQGKNIFLLAENIEVEKIDYDVNVDSVLLTGANSGGKTTLLQLIFQVHVLAMMGFYVPGNVQLSIYDEIYYFSKPTGKTDAGAFETLLRTFSKIPKENKKLILADEIEAITEPGAAAKILISILKWFKNTESLVIIVTHLAEDIKKYLEPGMRIDGIQAIGIDDGKLIVNRSPLKGVVAKSTPELIVQKLKDQDPFFEFIFRNLKEL